MANETATLAAYVTELKFDDIPPEVLDRAKVLTLDFLGSTIRARRDAESTPSLLKMLEALALDGKGYATVFGDSRTWTGFSARPRCSRPRTATSARRSTTRSASRRCSRSG